MIMHRIFYVFTMTAAVASAESERNLQFAGFFTSLFGGGGGKDDIPHPQEEQSDIPTPNIQLPDHLKPQQVEKPVDVEKPVEVEKPSSAPSMQLPSNLYNVIVSRDYTARSMEQPVNACIQVEKQSLAEEPRLILGDCDDYFTTGVVTGGWRLDEDDLFRSQIDDRYCMQAGNGNTPNEGNVLRVGLCDATLDSQKFLYFPNTGIRPLVDQTLCVVWKGQAADVGDDPILLNRCQWVRDRRQWEFGTV